MLFVDMDGVLADFDQHHENLFGSRPAYHGVFRSAEWDRIRAIEDFYATIPPMDDLPQLWLRISRHQPVVLTGIPRGEFGSEVARQKREWVRREIGGHVTVVTCLSVEKSLHCTKGDVLIDDWPKYRELWEAKQGVWITHTSALETSKMLDRMGL